MVELRDFYDEIYNCLQCGFCLAKCPVHREERVEPVLARGQMNLARALLDGELKPSRKMEELFYMCQLCTQCTEGCPSNVHTANVMIAARAELAKHRPIPFVKKLIFNAMKNPGKMSTLVKLGALGQSLFFKKKENMCHERIPVLFGSDRLLPRLSGRSLFDQLPEVVKVRDARMRVAYFTGCFTTYVDNEVGHAVLRTLTRNGIEVVVPKKQQCCGIPILAHGDLQGGLSLLRRNIELLAGLDVDYIVVDCTSCGSTLTELPEVFLKDAGEEFAAKAEKVKGKLYEVTEFLAEVAGFDKELGELGLKVTYHVPCHRNWSQVDGIRSGPRKLMEAIPGVTLVEMKEPEWCCGAAGSHMLTHYELASRIRDRKLVDIASTGADLVMSPCPGCRMHIKDGLNQKKMHQDTIHPIQILDKAYEAAAPREMKKAN